MKKLLYYRLSMKCPHLGDQSTEVSEFKTFTALAHVKHFPKNRTYQVKLKTRSRTFWHGYVSEIVRRHVRHTGLQLVTAGLLLNPQKLIFFVLFLARWNHLTNSSSSASLARLVLKHRSLTLDPIKGHLLSWHILGSCTEKQQGSQNFVRIPSAAKRQWLNWIFYGQLQNRRN